MRIVSRLSAVVLLCLSCVLLCMAQQSTDQHAGLSEVATAMDNKGAPALEARLVTTTLNGSDESPVTNVRIQIRNVSSTFYTYVTGWATFYDANNVRCGEGMFKLDALAAGESAEVDTPGLRLRCAPASWRVAAKDLLTRTPSITQSEPAAPPPPEPVAEKSAPVNFIISIDGEEHPIQVNNPIVLKLANKNRRIVLKPVQ